MPICRIETNEYECGLCRHRWTNRVNGKDGEIPVKCAKCKRSTWNRPRITAKENGLRRRVSYLPTLYESCIKDGYQWPYKVTQDFLNLDPRPTKQELNCVIRASDIDLNSQTRYQEKYKSGAPKSMLLNEAQKHINAMQQIIDYRKKHK